MKHISLRLIIALFTFLFGITVSAFWVFYSYKLDVESPDTAIACNFPNYEDHQISQSEKKFWNKEVLGRFREKPLENLPDSIDESYRLVLLPTFDAPIAVRIWREGDKKLLVTKKLSGEAGFGINKFGKLSYEKTRPLTEQEWLTFIKLLDQASFWGMSPLENEEERVCDGAEWAMESTRGRIHQNVHRITPNAEFRASCNYLLKLSGFENEYEGY